MNLRKTDRSELNLFPALSFLVVCFIGGYFLWATKDALPSEADNTDFRYAPSRAKELAQELDSIYSCKSGPGMEEFLETWHRKYTSNASAPDNQNDTLRNVYNLLPPSSIPTRRFVRGVSGAIRPTATSLSNRN